MTANNSNIEQLVELITERVILKLTANNVRIAKATPRAECPALSAVLNELMLGNSLKAPNGRTFPVITAITKHQLLSLLAQMNVPFLKDHALTKALKARNIYPFISELSNDPRNRLYIHGRQTVCYAFSTKIKDVKTLLMEIEQLDKLCPDLAGHSFKNKF